jgi:hypothetical protein
MGGERLWASGIPVLCFYRIGVMSMSLSLIEPKPARVLWLSVSPSLKLFDQPLLQHLRTSCPVAHWEYHQNQDEASGLEPALVLLCEYLHTLPQPVHVIGHGLSGVLALLLAARYPERVRSLTMLAVSGQPMATWHAHFYVQRQLLPCSREQLLIRTAKTLLAEQGWDRVRPLAMALAKELDTSPVPHSVFQVVGIPAPPVTVPILVCGSPDDPIVDPVGLGQWQDQLKQEDQVWSCPAGRHFFHYFFPHEVALRILEFWRGLGEIPLTHSMNPLASES